MTGIEVDSRSLSESVVHNGEADATGATATQAAGGVEGEWADGDEYAQPDHDAEEGKDDNEDEEDRPGSYCWRAAVEIAAEARVRDTKGKVFDPRKADVGRY